tara:strand:+ start:1197 stop:2480 length:1284 start_codon:yes stop_codon:yes gene_type:complete
MLSGRNYYISDDDITQVKKFSDNIIDSTWTDFGSCSDIGTWLSYNISENNSVVKTLDINEDTGDLIDSTLFIEMNGVIHIHDQACSEVDGAVEVLNRITKLVNESSNKILFYTINWLDSRSLGSFILYITSHVKNYKHPSNIWFMTSFPVEQKVIQEELDTYENVSYRPGWFTQPFEERELSKHYAVALNEHPQKRFSIFSRRITPERQTLYLELVDRDIIENCYYSFGTSHPDFLGEKEWTVTKEQMLEVVEAAPVSNLFFVDEGKNAKITEWIEGTPYTIGDYNHIYDPLLNEYTASSDIQIVIESFIEPANIGITEKLGRPFVYKTPFIVYGQPGIIGYLQKLGFRTFHPWIDETYDTIRNDEDRLAHIIEIVDTLNSMPDEEFADLMENIKEITEENYEIMKELAEFKLTPTFYRLGIFDGEV